MRMLTRKDEVLYDKLVRLAGGNSQIVLSVLRKRRRAPLTFERMLTEIQAAREEQAKGNTQPHAPGSKKESTMDQELYVVVAERDTYEPQPDSQPVAFEQGLNHATLAEVKAFQQKLGDRYGRTRLARLLFVEEGQEAAGTVPRLEGAHALVVLYPGGVMEMLADGPSPYVDVRMLDCQNGEAGDVFEFTEDWRSLLEHAFRSEDGLPAYVKIVPR